MKACIETVQVLLLYAAFGLGLGVLILTPALVLGHW